MKPKYIRLAWTAALAGAVALSAVLPVAAASAPTVTRGEVFKLIADKLKLAPADTKAALPSDVAADSPYANAVRVLKERKILEGYPDGTFKPDQPITQREFGYVLGRFLGIDDSKAAEYLSKDFSVKLGNGDTVTVTDASASVDSALKSDDNAKKFLLDANAKQTVLKSFRSLAKSKISFMVKPAANIPLPDTEATIDQEVHMEKGIHQTVKTMIGQQSMTLDQYIVPEGIYTKMQDPASGQQKWFKAGKEMPFNFTQLMQLQKLGAASKLQNDAFYYRDLGKDSKGLHGIAINGRLASLADILKSASDLLGGDSAIGQSLSSPEFAGMSLSMNGTLWINEETKLPAKMNMDLALHYGESDKLPFTGMAMSLDAQFSDYNTITDIVLPAEAKNAGEFPAAPVPAIQAK